MLLDSDVLLAVAIMLLCIGSLIKLISDTEANKTKNQNKDGDRKDETDLDVYINWLEQIGAQYTMNKECDGYELYDISYQTDNTSVMPESINYHVVFDYEGSRVRDYID